MASKGVVELFEGDDTVTVMVKLSHKRVLLMVCHEDVHPIYITHN